MSENSQLSQSALAGNRTVFERKIGSLVFFPLKSGTQRLSKSIEKGKIIELTDSGAVISGKSITGLYNRPWCEIKGVEEDLDLFAR